MENKTVPRNPTPEMLAAARARSTKIDEHLLTIWKSMYDAAPVGTATADQLRTALEQLLEALSPLKVFGKPVTELNNLLAQRVVEAVQVLTDVRYVEPEAETQPLLNENSLNLAAIEFASTMRSADDEGWKWWSKYAANDPEATEAAMCYLLAGKAPKPQSEELGSALEAVLRLKPITLRDMNDTYAKLLLDAEKWRAFYSSQRFYVMGWAGFTVQDHGETIALSPNYNPEYDWLHMTLNIWDKHPAVAKDDLQGRTGRAFLDFYVGQLMERRSRNE